MQQRPTVMKNLFEEKVIKELIIRIESLDKKSEPIWGKMNAGQMLAHCSEVLRNALGEKQQKRKLLGYIIAPFIRRRFYDDIPYKRKGVRSTFVIEDKKETEEEKIRLICLIDKFYTEGKEGSKKSIHPILGKFKPEQWAIGQYKHLDHHLRQFNV